MKRWITLFQGLFSLALRTYPQAYRDEFATEMQSVFADIIQDAARQGFFMLIIVFMQEMRDLPFNIAKSHIDKEFRMLRNISVQTTRLFACCVVLFTVMPLVSYLVYSLLDPLLGPVSLALSTFLSSLKLTHVFPTTEAYLPELQLGLTGLRLLLMAVVLALLLRREISAQKVFLTWGLSVILPALLWQAFFANYSLNFFRTTDDSQVYFLLGQVRMFMNILIGAALGYLLGYAADENFRSQFIVASALGYPLMSFVGRSLFPGPKTLADSLQWAGLASELGYGLVFGVALGLLFGIVFYFSARQGSSLKLA